MSGIAWGSAASSAAGGSGPMDIFGGSTGLSALQGLSTGVGLLSSMAATDTSVDAYKMQADEARTSAIKVLDAGQQQQAGLKAQLLDVLGQHAAAYGASGVDVGQGVVADTAKAATVAAGRAMQTDRLSTMMAQRGFIARADEYDQAATDAKDAGDLGILGSILGFGAKILGRG